jgi:OOP family OmpA-OmpF porin
MKKYIAFLLIPFLLTATIETQAQLGKLKEKIKRKVDQRIDRKENEAIDKTLDKAEGAVEGQGQNGNSNDKGNDKQPNVKTAESTKSTGKAESTKSAGKEELKTYSKYDFVPGEKLIAYEDFDKTAIGDFPTRWNTNATAEVVTVEGKEGKWLKFSKQSVFYPEFIKGLPDNFTLEFDVAVNRGFTGVDFVLNIANLIDANDFNNYYHNVSWRGRDALHLMFRPGYEGKTKATSRVLAAKDGNYRVNNNIDFVTWDNQKNNFAHFSLWRQNTRLRIYVNGEKIWDLPRAFDAASTYNGITFAADNSYQAQDFYLLGNIKLAIGAPDTRNKLITEGKFVTTGIKFDVNSDKLNPDSYGVLKEIAGALQDNSGVRIRIIGHTDSDGDDKANLDLSKRRAAAVKAALSGEFGIDASRMETDGMGESKPAGDNKTSEGKAQNRRVEFVKL